MAQFSLLSVKTPISLVNELNKALLALWSLRPRFLTDPLTSRYQIVHKAEQLILNSELNLNYLLFLFRIRRQKQLFSIP